MNEWMNEWIKENVERKKELPTPPVPSNPDGASEGEPEEDDPSVIEIFVAVQSRCRPYLLEVSGASMEEARAEVIDWCWKNFALAWGDEEAGDGAGRDARGQLII